MKVGCNDTTGSLELEDCCNVKYPVTLMMIICCLSQHCTVKHNLIQMKVHVLYV